MPGKMLAAVVEALGKPLVLRDWLVQAPGPGRLEHGQVTSRVVIDSLPAA